MNPTLVGAHQSPDDAAAVALRGASLAFRKKPSPDSTSPYYTATGSNSYSTPTTIPPALLYRQRSEGSNEALTAATSSAERARSPGRFMAPQTSGDSLSDIESPVGLHHAGLVAARLQQLGGSTTSSPGATDNKKNPSLIAATLAASRSVSPGAKVQRLRNAASVGVLNTNTTEAVVDAAPIPPTGSLISMFEKAKVGADDRTTAASSVKRSKSMLKAKKPNSESSSSRRSPSPLSSKSNPATNTPLPRRTNTSLPKTNEPTTPTPTIVPTASSKPRLSAASLSSSAAAPVNSTASTAPTARLITDSKPRLTVTPSSPAAAASAKSTPSATPSKPNHLRRSKTTTKDTTTPSPSTFKEFTTPSNQPKSSPRPRKPSPSPPRVISRSTPEVLSPKPTRVTKATLRDRSPPIIILRASTDIKSPRPIDPQKKTSPEQAKAPTPPKPRRSQRFVTGRPEGRPRGNSDTPPIQSSVKTLYGLPIALKNGPVTKSPPPPLSGRRESVVSAPPSPTHEAPRRRRLTIPNNANANANANANMQLSSLTSAIMAGSLAAARLTPHSTGSSLPPPNLPKRQRSPRLLQTLRRPASEDDEEAEWQKAHNHQHHRHKLRGNKHTHHEGSRKRWREKITDRERKRYEAVWASNRGLLLTDISPSASVGSGIGSEMSDCVVNIVVREIWKRSRLSDQELGEVWELVDRDQRGYLNRQEFVVGMWLLDQMLRGRKLPVRVGDSVWGSAYGVTVMRPKK